jgi:hypothetical protein
VNSRMAGAFGWWGCGVGLGTCGWWGFSKASKILLGDML